MILGRKNKKQSKDSISTNTTNETIIKQEVSEPIINKSTISDNNENNIVEKVNKSDKKRKIESLGDFLY